MDKYRLKYFTKSGSALNISFVRGGDGKNCDYLVRAESEPFSDPNDSFYSITMTLVEARDYIENNKSLLGAMVERCIGLLLIDRHDPVVLFKEPILVDG